MSEPDEDRPAEADGEAGGDGESSEESRRPISVRDLLPGPSSRPERRSRTEEARDRDDESEGDEEGDEGPAGPKVPTPVRVAMDAEDPSPATRAPEELPSRRIEIDGRQWVVRITGRTVTGTRPDAGALLMRLGFFSSEMESEEDDDGTRVVPEPERMLLTVDRPLDALYDEDLIELFRRSRPVKADEGVSM